MRRVTRDRAASERPDTLAVEEPLEIRVAGETLVMTMRTPGADSDLALGFLFAEGVIGSSRDVGTIAHCGRPDEDGYGNVIEVTPGPGVVLDPESLATSRRGTLTTAACGVCGRKSIDDLLARTGVVPDGPRIPLDVIWGCTSRLGELQPTFARTGALHAAAAFDARGELLAHAEDVGRHNAVDKVLGALVRRDALDAMTLLAVSGRISFEIVQKAVAAGARVVTGISAPTSLAVDLAERLGLTLLGFVREETLNVYAHPYRVAGLPDGRDD